MSLVCFPVIARWNYFHFCAISNFSFCDMEGERLHVKPRQSDFNCLCDHWVSTNHFICESVLCFYILSSFKTWMYLGSYVCAEVLFWDFFFFLIVCARWKEGTTPTNNHSLYLNPNPTKMDGNPGLVSSNCFGKISARIVTSEWPRNLFWIKPF